MEKFVNVSDAKADLSRLLDEVAQGAEIVIVKAGKPVARLVPYVAKRGRRKPGGWEGKLRLGPDWDSETTNREIELLFEGQDD